MSLNFFKKNSRVARRIIKKEFLKIVDYKCVICENGGFHQNKPLVLHLDHINGDRYDNRLENLRLLCPNCHSQQKTSNRQKGKQKLNKVKIQEVDVLKLAKTSSSIRQILLKLKVADSNLNYEKIRHILKLNNINLDKYLQIEHKADRNRLRPHHRKVNRPSKEELEKLVWEKPTSQLSKEFGVSDTAIAKWCKRFKIKKPPRGYWAKQRMGS